MVHIPPYFRRPAFFPTRTTNTYITEINIGSRGGHVHHCHGGGGGWGGNMNAWFGLGILSSFLSSVLGKGKETTTVVQQPVVMMPQQQMMGYNNYNIGYNAGLYTPGNAGMTTGGYNYGFNQGLYNSGTMGQYSTMQGQYGAQQAVMATRGNELVAMVKDLGNDYGFQFGENEEVPQLTPDGQKYTYKNKTFENVTDLRNFIEKQEGLTGADTSDTPSITDEQETVVQEPPITVGDDDTEITEETTIGDEEEVTTVTTPQGDPVVGDTSDDELETPVTTSPTGPEDVDEGETPVATSPTDNRPSVRPMTREQSEKMMAELEAVFGKVPSGVELNTDGTFNYGKYQNLNINALKYAVTAQENYDKNPESAVSYNNYVNNDKDRMYTDGQLVISKTQLSNAETYGAFLVRNNPETDIELGKTSAADFEKTFKNMHEDNVKDAEQDITEEEFMAYHKAYELNAKDGILKRDKERLKYETVNITSADEAHLKNFFYAMSNGSGKVTKQQYINFMTDLFSTYNGHITRAQLDDFCVNWLNKNN